MVRRFPALGPARSQTRLRRALSLFLLLQSLLVSAVAGKQRTEQQCSGNGKNYHHLVVLVHGYMGSSREQEYLAEALLEESKKKSLGEKDRVNDSSSSAGGDNSCPPRQNNHKFVILNSKANMKDSTDGIVKGGKRLAAEISDWARQQIAEVRSDSSEPTVITLSMVGNSLGGLYSRYALAEIDHLFKKDDGSGGDDNRILPLVFCTTSSPHLGVSRETFIELPRWTEPYVATVFRQQTMSDLFRVHNSSVVMDMCHINSDTNNAKEEEEDRQPPPRDYLSPLQQFQKRIAVANAYNTDFLVSVSSGAFLSPESDSIHHHQDSDVVADSSIRLMKDMEHVALQVATTPTTAEKEATRTTTVRNADDPDTSSCVNALDRLGWHKIFIDTRKIFPNFLNLQIPELEPRTAFTSNELKEHFQRYGTLLPVAHPLNVANSKTDWYRKLTKSGQPIVDALAELLVLDMVELSERKDQS